jgi:hypothetical protein
MYCDLNLQSLLGAFRIAAKAKGITGGRGWVGLVQREIRRARVAISQARRNDRRCLQIYKLAGGRTSLGTHMTSAGRAAEPALARSEHRETVRRQRQTLRRVKNVDRLQGFLVGRE